MKKKLTCIGLATLMFATMFSYICGIRSLMDGIGEYNIIIIILLGILYCMGIVGTALLGAFFWILAFTAGNEEETTEAKEGV